MEGWPLHLLGTESDLRTGNWDHILHSGVRGVTGAARAIQWSPGYELECRACNGVFTLSLYGRGSNRLGVT